MARNIGYLTAKKTIVSDECYTPAYAVEPIIPFLSKKQVIWCPFDDPVSSEFVKVLKKNGFKVIATHIGKGQDFFNITPKIKYDVIISNPPYSIKDKVIERCYELEKNFMLLMPLPTLQGKKRFQHFKRGLQLLIFDTRICYFANGFTESVQTGNSFASIYFCRGVLPEKIIFSELKINPSKNKKRKMNGPNIKKNKKPLSLLIDQAAQ